ncbi:redoxin domain-containing protein [Vibrio hannami]|uniref:peroxiredoxin family protein n=1 Tax=Vibrio hannami TaxID=2717094 RepID=UPI00240FB564|nr:redoxin domain-containing protein [Vibrio hannami]MDG3087468.1 redoxin domain-containing protein [Vibrio hannami]
MKKMILPLILLNMIGGIGSGIMFWLSGELIWLGSFLTTLPLPFFLMVLINMTGIARTSSRLPLVQLMSLVGIAFVAMYIYRAEHLTSAQYIAIPLAAFGSLFVQWYIRSFSIYNRKKSKTIVKGQLLPEFDLSRLDESVISSTSFIGSKTLIVFFRANWCPFCMNQFKEVQKLADTLKSRDVKVKFISNQGFDNSKKLVDKMGLPEHFEILQDVDLKAAKRLGIEDIGGSPAGMSGYPEDTVMATVITLDENGLVTFGDETDNYRVRPHPDTFLSVFNK